MKASQWPLLRNRRIEGAETTKMLSSEYENPMKRFSEKEFDLPELTEGGEGRGGGKKSVSSEWVK